MTAAIATASIKQMKGKAFGSIAGTLIMERMQS